MSPSNSSKTAIVVGGGIVGASCALYLLREGFDCTLIEKDTPGQASSGGNAGNLGEASFVPIALPGLAWRLPKMMLDPNSPLIVRWQHFPVLLPWFLRFVLTSRRGKVTEIASSLYAIMEHLMDAYRPLLQMSDTDNLVQQRGRLQVHESAAKFAGARFAIDMRRDYGIAAEDLTGDEARELEPALGPNVYAAYHMPNAYMCADPSELVQSFARALVSNGGSLLCEEARRIEDVGDGRGRVITDGSEHIADAVVVAAGPWSTKLVEPLGVRVPIIPERGYHAMLSNDGIGLKTPITAGDRYVLMSPMQHGLRVSGVAEYAAIETPPDWRLVDRMIGHAKQLLPGLSDEDRVDWQGSRPSTPDNKPVIDRLKRFPWAYLAFGHGHVGMGTGAITGRLISQLAAGREPAIDISPFRHDRRYF
ncbi:MAG: FAD-dependent oxidoreductase [Proteobacteria bacterium]|nr:FAD-dependent oxidoreductase [Pseudomonadota bacterium]